MKFRKARVVIITAVATLFVVLVGVTLLFRPRTLDIGTMDISDLEDGTYIGICQNKILFAVVSVEVIEHEITGIEVLEHKHSYMEQAKMTANNVLLKQGLDIDAISGATLTSDTVLKAIENALKQGS